MRVCMPTMYPGGPEVALSDSLEESDMLDYYELGEDGRFEQIAQTRNCSGACKDNIEAITRRSTQAVVVRRISPNSLLKFRNSGVGVYRGDSRPTSELLKSLAEHKLDEIKIGDFSRMSSL